MGAGVSAHEKNVSAQQRPLHTHTLIFSLSLLYFCSFLSLSPPPCHPLLSWAVRFSLVNQNICRRPYALFHLVLLLTGSRAYFFLDVPFDLFALTFLFKQAHKAIFAQLVTSWPVNVQCRSSTCLHNDTVLTAYICFLSPSLSLSVSYCRPEMSLLIEQPLSALFTF